MLASLLSPTSSTPPPRHSQLLPSVKCTTCHQPVPLSELGEHTCTAPPAVPDLPKPTITPEAAAALLPGRLQGRVASNARLQISTNPPTQPSFQPKSSPLARTDMSSPLRTRPPPGPIARAPSNPTSSPLTVTPVTARPGPTPVTARPDPPRPPSRQRSGTPRAVPPPTSLGPRVMNSPPRNPPPNLPTPPAPYDEFVPAAERGIDTKSGGAAGMAGVGRRGFAAAARAAMFTVPSHQHPPYTRTPQFLDIDAASRSTETPPLSPGSGYSSHSPSPGPTSPLPQSDPQSSIPFPKPQQTNNIPVSPRLPFFEKLKTTLPVYAPNKLIIPLARNDSSSSRKEPDKEPISPDSESEYGGLAYADSDYEEDLEERLSLSLERTRTGSGSSHRSASRSRRASPPLPPIPSSATVTFADKPSAPPPSHMQFGSVSLRSRSRSGSRSSSLSRDNDRAGIRIGGAGPGSTTSRGAPHSRDNSVSSSYSNASDARAGRPEAPIRSRSNSSAIAQALGLSQSSNYAKLGGPGVSRSLSRSGSASRERDRDREKSRERDRVGRDAVLARGISSGSSSTKSKHVHVDTQQDPDSILGLPTGSRLAGRSNTVQGLHSPDVLAKPIKLPTRSLTTPSPQVPSAASQAPTISSSSSSSSGKKAAAAAGKKPKTCLRCQKAIEDGRWVSVDGGGVLCERCWKNMYLPKCRRCTLPIERQAVSSSDGQLKGKYHKECFNCYTCHKPFPDKSFYVYDGKPLCAYHYHEANDSLCAAARCGQPIEGPCAVSHTGDRYHPEHMTCEYTTAGGYRDCRERLDEYWEVDGRMLCERHAGVALGGRGAGAGSEDGGEGEGDWERDGDRERERGRTKKAMKRVTRFIDLAADGGLR